MTFFPHASRPKTDVGVSAARIPLSGPGLLSFSKEARN